MNTTSPTSDETFRNLELTCERLCQLLEREHTVLRESNGLTGKGIDELEHLHQLKDEAIAALDSLSNTPEVKQQSLNHPHGAQRIRNRVELCKSMQLRNHQIFSRVVVAQRRILSLLRETDDSVSLYDNVGRTRDFGSRSAAARA